jgi:micrococcal nuclease
MNNLSVNESLYIYKAYVTDVYDGDTITCIIDCGFNIGMQKTKIRLYGINTPELRGEDREIGLHVRDELRKKILNKHILLKTIKDKKGKYGRYLGKIYIEDENTDENVDENVDKPDNNNKLDGIDKYICINDWLLENNYAVVYE